MSFFMSLSRYFRRYIKGLIVVWVVLPTVWIFSPAGISARAADLHSQDPSGTEDLSGEEKTGSEIGDEGTTRFEMDEVVVTATRQEDSVRRIPRNVTVITSDDIAQATSSNVVDLLAKEADLNLRSFFGSDKKAGIDIRGMGDTFVSNVIVMVDGFRLNAPDLAGADFSTVPLEQIERIEIVRGAGSVLYGDGAVGGVINIITKKGKGEPKPTFYSSYGSYDTFDNWGRFGGQAGDFSFSLNADYSSSQGYRDNGYLRKKNAGIQLGYDPGNFLRLSLGAAFHDDAYGLPGSVPKQEADTKDDRDNTDHPHDFGRTTDKRLSVGTEMDLESFGILNLQAAFRRRDNPYVMGYSPLIAKKDQTDTIDERSWQLNAGYVTTYRIGGLEQRFQCGLDYFTTDYRRKELSKDIKKNSDVETLDWFLQNEWNLTQDLIFTSGYRRSRYTGKFRDDKYESQIIPNPSPPPPFLILPPQWTRGETDSEVWKNTAFDFGLTCFLNKRNTSLFASYSKSFRNPNVDELADADQDLRPQKGRHLDIGLRHRVAGLLEASVTFFQIKIEDEIYYGEDPSTGGWFNRNYDDKTVRRGIEIDLKVNPADCLYLWGNYSYTRAKFDKSGNDVPLVPRHKAGIGLEWHILEPLLLSVTGTLVGSRYDGNDQSNTAYAKLKSYQVIDAKLSYQYKNMKIFGSINNIFDELYSTSAYSEYYYPMPTRNAYVGIEWHYAGKSR